MPKHQGRMIRKTISQSKKVSSLSPQALSLFCLLIPHFNSHGKMNGNPYFIKGEVVPIIKWFDINKIKQCLKEITEKTNVKWFEKDGLQYIHSINWNNHQDLIRRRGPDLLPEYSGTDPGVVPPEFEGRSMKDEGRSMKDEGIEWQKPPPIDNKRKSMVPQDYTPSDKIWEWARENNIPNARGELESFIDDRRSKGVLYLDFDGAFRQWLRNSVKFGPKPQSKSKTEKMIENLKAAAPKGVL